MEILSLFYPNMRTTNHFIPKIFGCVSFVDVHSPNKGKLDSRTVKCIFVGYSLTQKGYKCYHPLSNFLFFIFVLADVAFNKSEFYFPAPHLWEENSIEEDKNRDFYFIDPFLIDPPKVSCLGFDLVFVPSFSKLELSSIEPTLEN